MCQALHFALYVHFYVENQPQRGNCYSHFTGKGTRESEILHACYKWEVGLRVAFCPGLFVSCFLHLFCFHDIENASLAPASPVIASAVFFFYTVPGVGIQTVGTQKVVRIEIESRAPIVTKLNRHWKLRGYKGKCPFHNRLLAALAKVYQNHELLQRPQM